MSAKKSLRPKTDTDYKMFLTRVEKEFLTHPIILDNHYTKWFQQGNLSLAEVQHFIVQFSVFSNFFMIAQLKKVINAGSLEEMRLSKEILLNELGVVFNKRKAHNTKQQEGDNFEDCGDPAYVSTEGTIEGGTFKFKAAHFEWLLEMAQPLGLEFNDIGKRHHGTESTLFFVDELARLYGSPDFSTSAGASFSVENWAAAGFWKELIVGLKKFRDQEKINIPLAFLTWHDKVEDQHAAHTQDELKEIYFQEGFDDDTFIKSGTEMLEGVSAFWNGLNKDRAGNLAPYP